MRGYKTYFAAVAILLAAALCVTAQESHLKYLSQDSAFVLGLDFQKLRQVLPADVMEKMKANMEEDLDEEIMNKIDYVLVGIPETMFEQQQGDMYGFLLGSVTIDDFLNAADRKGYEVEKVQIGNLTAYYKVPDADDDDDDQDGYVAQADTGVLVIGTESGLQLFQEVANGSKPNVLENPEINKVLGVIKTSGLVFAAGVLPDQAKASMAAQNPIFNDVNALGLDADYNNDFLDLRIAMNSKDAASAEQLKMVIGQMMGMFKGMDPTGAVAELDKNMEYSLQGTMLVMTTGISKASLEKAFEQFAPMLEGMQQKH